MRTEWLNGLVVAGLSLFVVSAAHGQDASDETALHSPLAALEPLSAAEMDSLAGGADTIYLEQGTLMVNDTAATATAANNVLSSIESGMLSGNIVSNNTGFTTGVFNSGSGVGIAVNTSVIINVR